MNRYERKGEDDAKRGITACDLDDPIARRHWCRGHDRAVAAGLGKLPRFGLICRRYAAPVEPLFDRMATVAPSMPQPMSKNTGPSKRRLRQLASPARPKRTPPQQDTLL